MQVDGEKRGAETGVVRVVVDHRERPSGVPELLALRAGVEVSYAKLSVGDYKIDDHVLFERKTIGDFAESIIDTRLFRQASRLLRTPLRPALILEGYYGQSRVSVPREAMQGALISVTLVFGIPVLRATCPEETARLIVYAARQLAAQGQGASVWRYRTPKKYWNRRLHVLQSLPGVGRERATCLLAHFGTVQRCLAATAEDLCQVEGIGARTAQEIRRVVSEDNSEIDAARARAQARSSDPIR